MDYHHELVEHLANCDNILREMFLEEKTPTKVDVLAAIRRSTIRRAFTSRMEMETALENKGMQPLLDTIVDLMTNPSEFDNYCMDTNKMTKNEEGKEVSTKIRMNWE